jgi:Arc/MetJ-type ribon-helix-helix transcriptional regulator
MAKPEKTVQAAFRLPPSLIRQVDAHAKYLRSTTGMTVSRCDALRALLTEALEKRAKNGR